MYDLNSMRYFVKVVECRSFTQAARVLEIPKSTISDKIGELETSLGVSLLTRTTRKLTLTDVGAEYFKKAEAALALLQTASDEATQMQNAPSGTLRITAPNELVIVNAVGSAIAEFKKLYQNVKFEANFTDRQVDLIGEGYDIAIRTGNLQDSSLMAKVLGSGGHILVATESYLRKHKAPDHPKDLIQHECLIHESRGDGRWVLQSKLGKTATAQVQGDVRSNSFPALKAMALKGMGICLIPRSIGLKEIQEKKLTHVLPEWSTAEVKINLVYPGHKYTPPKTKKMIPLLEASIREILDLK